MTLAKLGATTGERHWMSRRCAACYVTP